ncbi:MAG: glycosyltransferase [Lachnospiraceae bacterium]|nr:glycosyltransferase [Lachnospiraceae bacterium]
MLTLSGCLLEFVIHLENRGGYHTMRVLIQSYNTVCQNKSGGMQIRVEKTANALQNIGIDVSCFNAFQSNINDCDILHIFMLDIENYALIRCAKAAGKKIVISSVINLLNGWKIDLYRYINRLPLATTYKLLFEILCMADAVIVETDKEAAFVKKHYKVAGEKIRIIPNGSDWINDCDSSIYKCIDRNSEYALIVGRFDENKNQLNVIRALKNTGIQTAFIGGGNHSGASYYRKCIQEAKPYSNFHFLGWVDHKSELIKSAYANCKTLIVPSYSETFGLTIVEGGMAGANLAVSKTLPILDYNVFTEAELFMPDDINSIKTAVINAMKKPKSETMKENIKRFFSWESVAQKHMELYLEILK